MNCLGSLNIKKCVFTSCWKCRTATRWHITKIGKPPMAYGRKHSHKPLNVLSTWSSILFLGCFYNVLMYIAVLMVVFRVWQFSQCTPVTLCPFSAAGAAWIGHVIMRKVLQQEAALSSHSRCVGLDKEMECFTLFRGGRRFSSVLPLLFIVLNSQWIAVHAGRCVYRIQGVKSVG